MEQHRTAVIFDVGLVLLHPDGDRIAAGLKDHLGLEISPECCLDAYTYTIWRRDTNQDPDLGEQWFWQTWCTEIGIPIEFTPAVRHMIAEVEEGTEKLWTRLDKDAHIVLDELRRRNFCLGVLSNADGELIQDLRRAGLADYFDAAVDSEIEGIRKPDPSAFMLAISRLGLPGTERAWFVGDDLLQDINPAIKLDFAGVIHYDRLGLYGAASGYHRVTSLQEILRVPALENLQTD